MPQKIVKKYIVQPADRAFFKEMFKAEYLCFKLNKTPLYFVKKRNRILKRLLGSMDGNPYNVQIPFHCAWGKNIHVGKNFYCGFNCVMIDHTDIVIGDNVLLAPNITISTAYHPFHPDDRRVQAFDHCFEPEHRSGIEICKPIQIGSDVYIASNCVICPGVTIGDGCVIGAGSVVTRDIPANTFACGVPCRVVRNITEEDKLNVKLDLKKGIQELA